MEGHTQLPLLASVLCTPDLQAALQSCDQAQQALVVEEKERKKVLTLLSVMSLVSSGLGLVALIGTVTILPMLVLVALPCTVFGFGLLCWAYHYVVPPALKGVQADTRLPFFAGLHRQLRDWKKEAELLNALIQSINNGTVTFDAETRARYEVACRRSRALAIRLAKATRHLSVFGPLGTCIEIDLVFQPGPDYERYLADDEALLIETEAQAST